MVCNNKCDDYGPCIGCGGGDTLNDMGDDGFMCDYCRDFKHRPKDDV